MIFGAGTHILWALSKFSAHASVRVCVCMDGVVGVYVLRVCVRHLNYVCIVIVLKRIYCPLCCGLRAGVAI